MISLDIGALATVPEYQRKLADFIIRSIDGTAMAAGSRFINVSQQQGMNVGVGATVSTFYYGYKTQSVTVTEKFATRLVYGEIELMYYLSASTGVVPTIQIDFNSPPALAAKRIQYHTAAIEVMAVQQVKRIIFPMCPISEIAIHVTCDGASTCTLQTRIQYSTLYFERD